MPQVILSLLRTELTSPTRIVKLQAVYQSFKLLEHLTTVKNKSAPLVYKSLVFSVMETIHDSHLRCEYWGLFKDMFMLGMPCEMLLEPLLRQTYKLYEFDFEFIAGMVDKQPIMVMQFWQEAIE